MPKLTHDPGRTRLRTLTVLAPVPEEAVPELTQRLRRLGDGPSPFAAVPGTHFARLTMLARDSFVRQPRPVGMRRGARLLDLLMHGGRPQRPDPPSLSYLLFTANYDSPERANPSAAYLDDLRIRLGDVADGIWELCTGYPGWSDRAGFLDFFAARSVPARYVFTATDEEPSVERIQQSLDLRQRVAEAALQTQGMPDDQLARHLLATFGPTFGPTPTPLPNPAPAPSPTPPAVPHPAPLLPRPASLITSPATPITSPAVPAASPAAVVPEPLVHPLAAEPALLDPPTGAALLANPDREPPTDPDLADVQNLVTSGYPRHHHGLHLLVRITDPVAARRWLASIADVIPTAAWAEDYVDRIDYADVERTLEPGSERRTGAPASAVHVALSYAGLARLGLDERELAGFSAEFRAGMAVREPGLAPGRGTSTWQPPFSAGPAGRQPASAVPGGSGSGTEDPPTPTVDLLVMFSAVDRETLESDLRDRPWLRPGRNHGLVVLAETVAGRIPEDRHGPGDAVAKPGFLEHFGYVDGLSQPRVHGVTAGRRVAELPAGEALLGYQDIDGDVAGAGLPPAIARNGSYLVYRKLEQDVPAFRALTAQLGSRLAERAEPGTDPRELAAAKLMGRWRDGTPVTLAPAQRDPSVGRTRFGYQEHDAEGYGCPVGAHIRRANPRDSRPVDVAGGPGAQPGLETGLALRHRMLRRGIPYGRPLPEGTVTDGEERGMLFVALVGDLRRQFEFVQAHWMSDGNAFRLGTDRDWLSGASEQGNKFVVQGTPPAFVRPDRPLVTCRGGEYFFLPGISALRRIATAR